ncbi:MAG: pyridoxal-dependent decarboxylase [Candidatus Eremiobacteraeota bacterium]|nr:pyridoxal-dependent decarboxylase [Candidatus Eremiobacteraeota bacterium]
MLDPADWEAFRQTSHEIVDKLIDSMQAVREQPTWQPVPETVKAFFDAPLPQEPQTFAAVYGEFAANILPYPTGNIHPRFFGWVHGSGTPAAAIAELMAAVMNSNVGGREHSAVYVERQVIRWFCELFGMSDSGSGILLGGTSMANFAGILVARTAKLGANVRVAGLAQAQRALVGYASRATHNCVRKAFEMAGLGNAALRVVETDERHQIDIAALERRIAQDRSSGATPFVLVGNAGTVDTGAFDPLERLAQIAQREQLWFHVDGAFGAMAMLSERLRPFVRGIERADSIAFDFHKWLHVPYDAACLLVRDANAHRATFASEGPYITRMDRGTASGNPWFADFGPDLSRSFRALKVWLTLKHFGTRRIAAAIEMNCDQARHLTTLVELDEDFELAAPVSLNIVCFRNKRCDNDALAIAVQESGRAVISSTTIGGERVLRACFTNHRTQNGDVDELWAALRSFSQSA